MGTSIGYVINDRINIFSKSTINLGTSNHEEAVKPIYVVAKIGIFAKRINNMIITKVIKHICFRLQRWGIQRIEYLVW